LSGFPYGIGQRLEFGRFEMIDAYSFGFGCCLVSVWFSFGICWPAFGLRLVLFVLACLLPFGSLVVRSSGLVLDSVDDVLNAWFACLVCLDSFVSWFVG
jgi:hypothetical protein